MIDETPRRGGYQTVRQAVAVGGGASGSKAKQFKIKSVSSSDYLMCHSYDGVTEGQEDVYVAKPWFLRGNLTWNGKSRLGVSYSATGPQVRIATKGTVSETQIVIPHYAVDDIIYAANAETGVSTADGKAITWIDLNIDGRMWATNVV